MTLIYNSLKEVFDVVSVMDGTVTDVREDELLGKVVEIKATYKISFPPSLTPEQIEKIERLVVNKKFKHTLKIVNEFSKVETLKVYFGNYSTDLYAFINGKMMTQSISFEAVEI